MSGAPELRTARLLLRHWHESDRDPWASMGADPEVMRYLGPLLSREQSDSMLDVLEDRLSAQPFGFWAVEVREPHPASGFIGFVGLSVPRFDAPFTPCTEVGWRLGRWAWGHGYATEAARAALDYA